MITQKSDKSTTEKVLRQIETESKKRRLPIIGPNKGKFLVDEVKKARPKHVLEVGTLIGYSTILMGMLKQTY
jgi:predicted O-methyltransferase YrrM